MVIMKIVAVAFLAMALCKADGAGAGCMEIAGNQYCNEVKQVLYNAVGGSGSYQKVTNMDSTTGQCTQELQQFSGPMAPFDEDLSIHLRGPLKLRSFAVFKPGEKQAEKRSVHHADKKHAFKRKHHRHIKKDVGDMVTATINGKIVSWKNSYDGTPVTGPQVITATINGKVVSWTNQPAPGLVAPPVGNGESYGNGQACPAPSTSTITTFVPATPDTSAHHPASPAPEAPKVVPAPPPPPASNISPAPPVAPSSRVSSVASPAPHGDQWARVAYFNSDEKISNGMVYLNNLGGQGSGVWDKKFGNSLSYASEDGKAAANGPQLFAGELDSNTELGIFSDQLCDDGCGFVRPKTVAYKGFAGPEKAFFFDFMMPGDPNSGGRNSDKPAIWALNAQIPRVGEYLNDPACSCWTSGCGEVDIFEVLDPGNNRCTTTLHSFANGGTPNFFSRPTSKYLKVAVLFHNNSITIKVLDDSFEFGSVIDASQIDEIAEKSTACTVIVPYH
ncbi:hypothetical protein EJ06DRAFT_556723 [Trichodelitschia bisporula]|uniref:glucan endo-1,3-beta-D-glucosidase n=1 Tax=Trichodelitschia bisporula TaxID=703511 RepID=A0A6G1HWX0_9PEZI|nr:hypothetical protein EJ06DRAFT_556723 [Trichodelitschia bisporula]